MDTDTSHQRALTRHIKHTLRLTFVGLIVERGVQAFLWFGVLACLQHGTVWCVFQPVWGRVDRH